MISQWDALLKNLGTWQGSFTRLSPDGQLLEDIPSQVSLTALDNGAEVRQVVRKQPAGAESTELVLQYRSLNRSVLFLENGAFSQGSIQWGPFSQFGAELGLIHQDRRLRLVQLYDKQGHLSQITLIREVLAGGTTPERPQLTLADLLGTWKGAAVTLYPDLRSADRYATQLEITASGHEVEQRLTWCDRTFTSRGQIQGNRLVFPGAASDTQVLLLPDGASSTCPLKVGARQPLMLEVGWLLAPNQRQRLIRRYGEKGDWLSLTLVTEKRC